MIDQETRDRINDERSPSPSYLEALEVCVSFNELGGVDESWAHTNDEYLRGQIEMIADCFPQPHVPIDVRKDEVEADLRWLAEVKQQEWIAHEIDPDYEWPYPHIAPGDWTRGRLVRELQEGGWWSVAEDVAEGEDLSMLTNRLRRDLDYEAAEIIRLAEANDV